MEDWRRRSARCVRGLGGLRMAGDRRGASLGTLSFVGDGVELDMIYGLTIHV